MEKIRLTKNELKKQKDSLKRYRRYLPTLYIKKQQLQKEIASVTDEIENLKKEEKGLKDSMLEWAGVFCEEAGLEKILKTDEIIHETDNIAGVDIPVLKSVIISSADYDLLSTPLWTESGLAALKLITEIRIKAFFLNEKKRVLSEELRATSQRVNLFEKIKIPEAEDSIRRISVYLGDLNTAAVGWARIAKKRL